MDGRPANIPGNLTAAGGYDNGSLISQGEKYTTLGRIQAF